jgi:hypothetical protein
MLQATLRQSRLSRARVFLTSSTSRRPTTSLLLVSLVRRVFPSNFSKPHFIFLSDPPKAVDPAAVLADVKKSDWREDLKHVEPAKDASAPVIERM